MQPTGGWQYDGIMRLVLHSVKSISTKKYHVFAPMGRFQLDRNINILDGTTMENKGKLILSLLVTTFLI